MILPRFSLSLGLLAILLCGCEKEFRELNAPTFNDEPVQWGQPVNDLQVGIARRVYEPGKAPAGKGLAFYSIRLRNTGKKELKALWPVEPGFGTPKLPLAGDESLVVTLQYEAAGQVRTAQFKPPNRPIVNPLPPGQEVSFELRILPGKFGLESFAPGLIQATYANQQASIDYGSAGVEIVTGLWTGSSTSGKLAAP